MFKLKIILTCLISVVILVIILCFLTPYEVTVTYLSSQRVPHSVVVDRGVSSIWDSMEYSEYSDEEDMEFRVRDVDMPYFLLMLTVLLSACVLTIRHFSKVEMEKSYAERVLNKSLLSVFRRKPLEDTQISIFDSFDFSGHVIVRTLFLNRGYRDKIIDVEDSNLQFVKEWIDEETTYIYMVSTIARGQFGRYEERAVPVTRDIFYSLPKSLHALPVEPSMIKP